MSEKKEQDLGLETVSTDELETASGGVAPLVVAGALGAAAIAGSIWAKRAEAPTVDSRSRGPSIPTVAPVPLAPGGAAGISTPDRANHSPTTMFRGPKY